MKSIYCQAGGGCSLLGGAHAHYLGWTTHLKAYSLRASQELLKMQCVNKKVIRDMFFSIRHFGMFLDFGDSVPWISSIYIYILLLLLLFYYYYIIIYILTYLIHWHSTSSFLNHVYLASFWSQHQNHQVRTIRTLLSHHQRLSEWLEIGTPFYHVCGNAIFLFYGIWAYVVRMYAHRPLLT